MHKVIYFNCIKLGKKLESAHGGFHTIRPTSETEQTLLFLVNVIPLSVSRCVSWARGWGVISVDMGRRALLKCRSFSSWHNNSTWIRIVRHSEKLHGWHLSPGEGELSHHEVVRLKRVWHSVSSEIALNQSGGSSLGQPPKRRLPCSLLYSSLLFLFLC